MTQLLLRTIPNNQLDTITMKNGDSSREENHYHLLSFEEKSKKIAHAYKEYYEPLLRFCFFRLSDHDKALDIVQETFTHVWSYILKDNYIENEKSFLYTTAKHLIIDEYRKKKSISLDSLLAYGVVPETSQSDNIYTKIDARSLLKCVDQLPTSYSMVLLMRYINDYSVQDIARRTNTTENVISVRIHRGLSKLRVSMLLW